MNNLDQLVSAKPQETLWRTLQAFNAARIVIVAVLFTYLSVTTKTGSLVMEQLLYLETCVIYLLLAIIFSILSAYCKRYFLVQMTSEIVVDISVISILYISAGGLKSGLAILYLFPLAGGAILAPLLVALFFVSVATIMLLAESGYQILKSATAESISQTGLYGAAFFVAVFAINRLAARLLKQEALAVQRGQDLQVQHAITRLILADMGDGILVADRHSVILTANPAAERMLGLLVTNSQTYPKLTEILSLVPIADAFSNWLAQPSKEATDSGASVFVMIKPDLTLQGAMTSSWGERRELAVHLKLRFAMVKSTGVTGDRVVIFLQDVSEIENRAQQLKLASMGRLTASIAHEVRNPLAAIAHASALIGEDLASPAHIRLIKIINDNVTRLNRMIEDILKLSRKAQSRGKPILLSSLFAEILTEFQQTHGIRQGMIQVDDMGQHRVLFDPLHLREVVINLLSNAIRYASGGNGSIRLYLVSSIANRLELHVQDDGPAISSEVRAHLFEPFYTTSSKGTGLGLYVARELCLNNEAMLDYEYRSDLGGSGLREKRGRFVITFAVPHLG